MAALQFGMPALLELPGLAENAETCAGLGLKFVELNMNLPQYQTENLHPAGLMAEAQRNGIYFTLHLDENLDVCSFNSRVANAYFDTVLRAIRLARQARIPILNMHLNAGVHFTLPGRRVYLYDAYRGQYLSRLRLFRSECEKAAGDSGVKLCVENTDGFLPFQKEGVKTLLESPVFGLTWDIGHDHAANGADAGFLYSNIGRLCHMHVHDARGKSCHLPLGTGEINLKEKLKTAQKSGCRCLLEVKTLAALKQSVEYLKRSMLWN
ncbi:MAG: sugar phosphate isomerase/epimerase [Oscillospiraceae bacterium]|jgi:sugar phosphate isomerase/epimerase|nr:sugar phosphate isomerase/epimerase [Oscillospiraceae bacterium]